MLHTFEIKKYFKKSLELRHITFIYINLIKYATFKQYYLRVTKMKNKMCDI